MARSISMSFRRRLKTRRTVTNSRNIGLIPFGTVGTIVMRDERADAAGYAGNVFRSRTSNSRSFAAHREDRRHRPEGRSGLLRQGKALAVPAQSCGALDGYSARPSRHLFSPESDY